MCEKELEELKRLSKIVYKLESKFNDGYILTLGIARHAELYDINSMEELLES